MINSLKAYTLIIGLFSKYILILISMLISDLLHQRIVWNSPMNKVNPLTVFILYLCKMSIHLSFLYWYLKSYLYSIWNMQSGLFRVYKWYFRFYGICRSVVRLVWIGLVFWVQYIKTQWYRFVHREHIIPYSSLILYLVLAAILDRRRILGNELETKLAMPYVSRVYHQNSNPWRVKTLNPNGLGVEYTLFPYSLKIYASPASYIAHNFSRDSSNISRREITSVNWIFPTACMRVWIRKISTCCRV